MSEAESPVLKKGIEIARILNDAGLPLKECTLINKGHRIFYTRGDRLIEMIGQKIDKIGKIINEGEQGEAPSSISIAQRLLKDNLLVKLERVQEEKKYYWPRKLAFTNVSSSNRLEYSI